MGKKNHFKRRELEKQQSISGKKKIKTVKPNRKELQNLKEFGTADGDLLETFDNDKSKEFEGRTWTFDSKGELIDGDEIKSEQIENNLTILNIPTNLNNIQLGKSISNIAITKKTKNPFSKLLSNLGVNKKKYNSETKIINEKVPAALDEEIEVSRVQEVPGPLMDNFSDEDAIVEDDFSSSEDESSKKKDSKPKDFYEAHFGDRCYGAHLSSLIDAVNQKLWNTLTLYQTSKEDEIQTFLTIPKVESDNNTDSTAQEFSSKLATLKLCSISIKSRLNDPWLKFISKNNFLKEKNSDFSNFQTPFFHHINQYQDVYYPLLDFNCETELRASYILHILNHVYKTRDRVIKNTVKITKLQEDNISYDIRDSGFTRPKVLILLPFRSSAVKIVDLLYRLSGCEQQENRKRFKTEFCLPDGTEDPILRSKTPEDHKKIFAGNSDDCFKLGIKFTRKAMKLYTPFYNSDIIIASPLGLRLVVGDSKDQEETREKISDKKRPKRKDHDFLSSIEILILDQADHLLMQNWDHVLHVNKHSNLIPSNPHDCDFSRVKSWYLEGQSKYLRQTILLSALMTPELNSFMRTSNVAGQVHFRASSKSTISDVRLPSKQTFHRVSCLNHSEADDKRFQYFIDNVLPNIRRKASAGVQTLIFIPSYFDFTRVRNYLTDHEYSFGQASEYSEIASLTRDRHFFVSKKLNLFLYTERCHFYRRYKIKGADQIIFYGLPEFGQFYPELIDLCNTPDAAGLEPVVQVTVLFTVYDFLKLDRILGLARSQKACHGALSTLIFS